MRFLMQLFTVLTIAILSSQASAADAVYKAFSDASDAYEKIIAEETEINAKLSKMKLIGDPYLQDREGTKAKYDRLSKLSSDKAVAKRKYEKTLAAWKKQTAPYTKLENDARAAWLRLSKVSTGLAVNRQRAMKAIELDLARLIPGGFSNISDVEFISNSVKASLRSGRPIKEIQEQLDKKMTDSLASKFFVSEALSAIGSEIDDLPGAERVKRYSKALSNLSKFHKGLELLTSPSTDPLKTSEVAKLTGVVDLISDLVPITPLAWQLQLQKNLLEQVQSRMDSLRYLEIRQNLVLLEQQAMDRSLPHGDKWFGLNPQLLFGIPGPNPMITPNKSSYKVGEAIEGTWRGSLRYDKDAWLGIVPSNVVHVYETQGDRADLDYIHLDGNDNGSFKFSKSLPSGDYDLRIYDDDDGGREAYWVTIYVFDESSALPTREKPWEGTWTANAGAATMKISLKQESGRVTGTFTDPTGLGSITEGRFSGSTLRAKWKNPHSRKNSGTMIWTLSRDQKTFSGTWKGEEDSSGTWNGTFVSNP